MNQSRKETVALHGETAAAYARGGEERERVGSRPVTAATRRRELGRFWHGAAHPHAFIPPSLLLLPLSSHPVLPT